MNRVAWLKFIPQQLFRTWPWKSPLIILLQTVTYCQAVIPGRYNHWY